MRIVFSVITGCLLALSACTGESASVASEAVVDVPTAEAPLQEVVPSAEVVAPTADTAGTVETPTDVPTVPTAE